MTFDATNSDTIDTPPFSFFEWLLALRYLRARRKEGFISVIATALALACLTGAATADCMVPLKKEVVVAIDIEAQLTEEFRTGNKPLIAQLRQLRAKHGTNQDDTALLAEITAKMLGVHKGLDKQNSAINELKANLPSAMERGDCMQARAIFDKWHKISKARVDEYREYKRYWSALLEKERVRPAR